MEKNNKIIAIISTGFLLFCLLLIPLLTFDLIGEDYTAIEMTSEYDRDDMPVLIWLAIICSAAAFLFSCFGRKAGTIFFTLSSVTFIMVVCIATRVSGNNENYLDYATGFWLVLVSAAVCLTGSCINFSGRTEAQDIEIQKLQLEIERIKLGHIDSAQLQTEESAKKEKEKEPPLKIYRKQVEVEVEYIICPQCGAEQNKMRVICTKCAAYLGDAASRVVATEECDQQQTQSLQQEPSYAPAADGYMYCQSCGRYQSKEHYMCNACGVVLKKDT